MALAYQTETRNREQIAQDANKTVTTAPTVTKAPTISKTSTSSSGLQSSQINDLGGDREAIAKRAQLPVSTTTISNQNKINQIPKIVGRTQELSRAGITTDADGVQRFANDTIVPEVDASSGAPDLSKPGVGMGGYFGEVYYAPGAQIPKGPDGKPVKLRSTSPSDDRIMGNIDALKAQSDKITASIIDSIKANYSSLRSQQETANKQAEGQVNNALLMGGVTGSGSSAQFAPISSTAIMSSQISYGLAQIGNLNAKEASAIIEAQQAGLENDFQLMDKKNAEISKIRDEKVAAAVKLNDTIQKQNEKLADEQIQATKDTAISELYLKGVRNPAEIQKQLSKQGLTVTSKDIADTIGNITAQDEFEWTKQQAAIKFAVENNITEPFYLVGNTAINSATGQPVSYQEYLQLTGQPANTPEDKADWSFLQTDIVTPEEMALAQNQSQFEDEQALEYLKLNSGSEGGFTLSPGQVRYDASGNVVATGGPAPLKPLTEAQAKDVTYAQRTEEANQYLKDLESSIAGYNSLGFAAQLQLEANNKTNPLASPQIKQLRQAERNFGTAVLRRESGAAISPSEFETMEKQYFPRPGDDEQTLKQKAQNRQTAIDNFKASNPNQANANNGGATGALQWQDPSTGDIYQFPDQNSLNQFKQDNGISFNSAGKASASTPYLKTLGAITGLDGSAYWDKGLDVDLKKGDPVKSPVNGKILAVKAGYNGGFGNQIKIQDAQGNQIWLSHLDKIGSFKQGQTVKAGQVIALGGNTGRVIPGKGGDGSHLDITMKNPKGQYYTARQVKSYLDKQYV